MRIIQRLHDIYQKDGSEFVVLLYKELMHREPAPGELQHHRDFLPAGQNKIAIVASLIQNCERDFNQPLKILSKNNSTINEVLQTFYQSSETQYVQSLYRELLFREPDEGGLQSFVHFLRQGGGRLSVLISILTSPECTALLAAENPPWRMNLQNLVSFIIPTFNQIDLVKQCVKSLKDTVSQIAYEIIVVDDGSQQHIQQQLLNWSRLENVTVVLKGSNEGFSRTVNEGIKRAKGKYVLLVNNDVIFQDREWLIKMINAMHSSAAIGVVGARLLYPDQTIQHGGIAPEGTGFCHRYRGLPGDFWSAAAVEDVHAVTGALFLINQEVIADIGLFSEDYFTAYEDIDFCYRARLKGWRIIYCGQASAIHLEGKTRGAFVRNSYYTQKEFEAMKQFEMKWSEYFGILKT
ncbi:glycosyltransferase [Aneurinibacillus sp. Ricciae_BoGa-3]|uniref:glycosyltransferase n=1 Tax=Aneurinibacillus sp. Ricciae_BoGa-3 TaxID=3022697 RepID=UPI0023427BE1|nr:glycosyltransferase [Aneurinibacillus sp. Ricciae_BoGa-3]WCK56174.1 glycosyltransferase [Aneurinibacillus sp. Ricciae_BoGa-3]